MKKFLISIVATLGLLAGAIGLATPAQAASNFVLNAATSTCSVQYKDFNGTIRTLAPSSYSVYSVWMVRIPAGCSGSIGLPYQPQYALTPGVWKSFTSIFPSGSSAVAYSYA